MKAQKDTFFEKYDNITSGLLISLIPKPIANLPGKFVKLDHFQTDDDDNDINEASLPKVKRLKVSPEALNMQVLDAIHSFYVIFETYPKKFHIDLKKSLVSASTHLLEFELKSVRIYSCKILEKVFSTIDSLTFKNSIEQNIETNNVPLLSPVENLWDIVEKLCQELESEDSDEEHIRRIFNIFLLLGNLLINVNERFDEIIQKQQKSVDLNWLCKKICRINLGESYHSIVLVSFFSINCLLTIS